MMFRYFIILLIALFIPVSYGDERSNSPSTECCNETRIETRTEIEAESNSTAFGGNNQNKIVIEGGRGTDVSKNVPSVNPPGLHGSVNGLCAYSFSAGISLPGIGVSGGKIKFSELCERIEASKTLWQLGLKLAAKEVICDIDFIHAARERAYARHIQEGNIEAAKEVRCLSDRPDNSKELDYSVRSNWDDK